MINNTRSDGMPDDSSCLDPDSFIGFCKNEITLEDIITVRNDTVLQSKSSNWYKIRYGRITASRLYEASRCKTPDGSLSEVIEIFLNL